jgi:hypothetical protein
MILKQYVGLLCAGRRESLSLNILCTTSTLLRIFYFYPHSNIKNVFHVTTC